MAHDHEGQGSSPGPERWTGSSSSPYRRGIVAGYGKSLSVVHTRSLDPRWFATTRARRRSGGNRLSVWAFLVVTFVGCTAHASVSISKGQLDPAGEARY